MLSTADFTEPITPFTDSFRLSLPIPPRSASFPQNTPLQSLSPRRHRFDRFVWPEGSSRHLLMVLRRLWTTVRFWQSSERFTRVSKWSLMVEFDSYLAPLYPPYDVLSGNIFVQFPVLASLALFHLQATANKQAVSLFMLRSVKKQTMMNTLCHPHQNPWRGHEV